MTKKQIDKESIFAKGRTYEQLDSSSRRHIFLGCGGLIGALFFIASSLWTGIFINYFVGLFLFLVSTMSLYIGYLEKKELGELK